ncbi:MAG: serine hydrolase, partial [Bacteroidetes bacterium]|nr:serine hydrolase [Bacteroidota bacterium]
MKTINLLIIFFSVTVQAILGQTEFRQEDLIKATVYSKNTGGAAVLVMQNNNIIYENYHNGSDSNTATHIHSATKGFWSAVAALALQKGLITSYDELVSNTITEWQNSTIHPNKKLIKIRHLLPLSSGLSQDVEKIQGEDATAKDIYQYVVDSLKLITAPGTVFQYGPSHYYAFGVLLQRKLHSKGILLNPLQYLENEILNKIGLQYDKWTYDSSGNPHIPNGCYLTPRNWIRFGQFMLQKGKWNGIQIIDSTLIKDMFKGDGPNPGHGKFIWLNAKDGYSYSKQIAAPPGSTGGFMYFNEYTEIIGALGAGKNRMYIIPTLNGVIVRQTLLENDSFEDNTFLSLILDNATSVEEESNNSPDGFLLNQNYPNPFNPETTIEYQLSEPDYVKIKIYDVKGELINSVDEGYKPSGN